MNTKDKDPHDPIAGLPAVTHSEPDIRRPTPNPPLDGKAMDAIAEAFVRIRGLLEEAAANLRALDRERINGVGIKKQGFIQRACTLAAENQQFLPPYISAEKFRDDFQYFANIKNLCESCEQLHEFLWNLAMHSADISYTDALEFYAAIREAAKRRIDGSVTVYKELEPFFKTHGNRRAGSGEGGETKKQLKRDFNALLRGERDGVISIENIKPHVTAGVRKVVDEKFTNKERFAETKEGEIDE
jgi:hypothetical protein